MARRADGRKSNSRPEGTFKYDVATERQIVAILKEHGLTGGYNHLRKTKVVGVRGCGPLKGEEERVTLSLPALQQLAARRGVKFTRGPRQVA